MDTTRHLIDAWRAIRSKPATSTLAVLALGLGIGLTTAMFSLIRGIAWSGLPFEDSHRLMHLECSNLERNQPSIAVVPHDFVDWREQQSTFEPLAAFDMTSFNLSDDASFPERQRAALVTYDTFRALRVEPVLGRDFTAEDDQPGAPPVVILGHALWRSRYESDPQVIGRTIRVNGVPTTVIGIMPLGFEFPYREAAWMPLRLDLSTLERGQGEALEVFGRLRDGNSLKDARADFEVVTTRLEETYPEANAGLRAVIKPYQEEFVTEDTTKQLVNMLVGAGLVLFIACANAASLLLARASARGHELAVRTSMGARRGHLIGQLLTEGLVLSGLGAVLGLIIARLAISIYIGIFNTQPQPFWIRIELDPQIIVFVVAVTLVAGVASGLLPALRSSQADITSLLKDEARSSSSLKLGHLNRLLLVGEITLAFVLTVATSLMMRTVINLNTADLGYNATNVVFGSMRLPSASYPQQADRIAFYDRLVEEAKTIPGVESAAVMSDPPGTVMGFTYYNLEGVDYPSLSDYPGTFLGAVSPEFFETYQVSLLAGRLFNDQDVLSSQRVVIVNESFIDRVWTGETPGSVVGKRVRFGRGEPDQTWRIVVGVAADATVSTITTPRQDGLYIPHAQIGYERMSVAVRTRTPMSDILPKLRAKVLELDSEVPIYDVNTMEQLNREWTIANRLLASVFNLFGFAALVLASVGVYGVMTFSVGRRVRELGLRMALGARRTQVLTLIMRQAMNTLLIGLAIGLGIAFALTSTLRSSLYRVEPNDPSSFVSAAVILAAVVFIACAFPAARAARIDPIKALRYE